jgi:hypothetical protein
MSNLTSVKVIVGVIAVAVLATPLLAEKQTSPSVGIYSVSSYVVSATAACGTEQGSYLSSYFSYPGPAKTGAVERHSIHGAEGSFIQELDFPTTPAANDTWSGNYSGTRFPGGTPQTAKFSTTFTFVDQNSFLATTSYVYPAGEDSTCTTVFQNTYILTGK